MHNCIPRTHWINNQQHLQAVSPRTCGAHPELRSKHHGASTSPLSAPTRKESWVRSPINVF